MLFTCVKLEFYKRVDFWAAYDRRFKNLGVTVEGPLLKHPVLTMHVVILCSRLFTHRKLNRLLLVLQNMGLLQLKLGTTCNSMVPLINLVHVCPQKLSHLFSFAKAHQAGCDPVQSMH